MHVASTALHGPAGIAQLQPFNGIIATQLLLWKTVAFITFKI